MWRFTCHIIMDRLLYFLARMVLSSGSDAAVAQFGERLATAGMVAPLVALLPRLDEVAQLGAVRLVLSGEAVFLLWLNGKMEAMSGCLGPREIMPSRAYKEIRAAMAGNDEERTARFQLPVLGFLAAARAARTILTDMTTAGLAAADPALALLRLNAALDAEPRP